ncbi:MULTISPECIES: TIGR03936 family radical SAM-associated protein [unclassified Ruminococcus]|uniref:TIGR03936 family radical SAM-associated protein n=1 Tax=unclassified Ruminococcus TaxID=2608920 RepID=UPI00210BCB50|nr:MULTISPECIES: TIGR03936 family radical SAM-associated protein [unclassified Ruminococcus]
MKSVRIWFKKDGLSRFISHLDLNKVMTLAINRSRIPIWHTEGFNPHPFLTFALPLSLGFCGECETMDIKIEDDSFDISQIPDKLNMGLPEGIRAYKAAEPVMKPAKIALASYKLRIGSDTQSAEEIYNDFNSMLSTDSIITQKKTKKGIKDIDIKPHLSDYSLDVDGEEVVFFATLPAGSTVNINPILYINALTEKTGREYYYSGVRTKIMNEAGESFE